MDIVLKYVSISSHAAAADFLDLRLQSKSPRANPYRPIQTPTPPLAKLKKRAHLLQQVWEASSLHGHSLPAGSLPLDSEEPRHHCLLPLLAHPLLSHQKLCHKLICQLPSDILQMKTKGNKVSSEVAFHIQQKLGHRTQQPPSSRPNGPYFACRHSQERLGALPKREGFSGLFCDRHLLSTSRHLEDSSMKKSNSRCIFQKQ